MKEKGIDANLDKITREIKLCDRRDSGRKISLLVPADDAFYLDSSDLTIDEVNHQVVASTKIT